MTKDSKKEVDDGVAGDVAHGSDKEQIKNKKKKNGVFSRIFRGIFRFRRDDFEERLHYISKEEAAILTRMKRRSHSWRGVTTNLIVLGLALEVAAVGYAIMTTRSLKLSWQIRAMRVLPMFLLPVLAFLIYSALGRFTRMCDRRDENNLEKLRAEREEKIDELKERTNYYNTIKLIQRYDPDPASKALAASVLASKLGADSGMKVYLGEEHMLNAPTGNSNDMELVQPGGLRNRKHSHTIGDRVDGTVMDHPDSDMLQTMELDEHGHHQMVVDHFQPTGSSTHDGSWIARLAALLVGEDPTQSYALICGNCHNHNGLARKEDYPYIIYYCPYCKVLNKPKQIDELIPGSSNLPTNPSSIAAVAGSVADIDKDSKGSVLDTLSASSPIAAAGEGITSLDTLSTSSPTAAVGEFITSVSSVTDDASIIADIDKDSKASVVDMISTSSPVAAAGEGITSASPVTDAAGIDEGSKGSAVDTISSSSPVAAAGEGGEGNTSPSSLPGTAKSATDIDKDIIGSMVDTLSTGSPVAAADKGSTEVESTTPQAPSSS